METSNLSKIRREKMLETINDLKKNITDEKTLTNLSLIENELTKKKYGLIWEEHQERVDKELETQIPTFKEIKDKEIISNKSGDFNFLLEGDNLHSLYLLEKTHKEKIDAIIIDPPYNTGSNDFMYGDSYLNYEDEFKHSKWLSFMNNRLKIAKKLLNDSGLIFINIDDNEMAQLKLLCDDIFGEESFVNCICVKMSEPTGVKMAHCEKKLPKLKEYVLVYKKQYVKLNNIQIRKEKWDEEYKILIKGVTKEELLIIKDIMDKDVIEGEDIIICDNICSKMIFSNINELFKNDLKEIDKDNIRYENAYRIVRDVATTGGAKSIADKKRIFNSNSAFVIKTPQNKIYLIKNGYNIETSQPRIKLLFADRYLTNNPCDLWTDIKTTGLDNEGFVKFLNGKKPLKMIERILELINNKDALILDFFAGSGTTGQAVLELNKDDNGTRKFILCTNNDNKICEDITYKRILKSIELYKNSNLKYYRTSYIPRINTEKENLHSNLLINVKNLIQLENGIEVDDNKIRIYLNEDDLDKFSNSQEELNICDKVYISSDILLTSKQEKIFEDNNIEVYIIPEYYFKDEIMEVM
ncbi:MAG: site-specific DNA-methyltransferase [Erysipelotrichaceae bacterium]